MFHRSTIGVLKEDGSVEAIHLYFDADSASTYTTLHSDYLSLEKVEELLVLGDLMSLGRYIRSENYVYRPSSDFCLAFQRDDGLDFYAGSVRLIGSSLDSRHRFPPMKVTPLTTTLPLELLYWFRTGEEDSLRESNHASISIRSHRRQRALMAYGLGKCGSRTSW
jgi:hypothetical protein